LKVNIEKDWLELLKNEFNKEYFNDLLSFIDSQYKDYICYPPQKLIFSALNNCAFNKLKVVIIGQDPYHGPNQANGMCFSVNSGSVNPPSLNNIFKEISNDFKCNIRKNGNLIDWARQGVMLLNSVMSVKKGSPRSHNNKGWEKFTDNIIKLISENKSDVVFMLWGSYAIKKISLIDNNKHLVLKSGHPSPLSANRGYWYGNKHFTKCNNYLIKRKIKPINWL
jgi:uracil-DNA glycosylase